ncbi:MAG TPA: hypothetical protein VN939_10950 [Chthoniobacterales bacterium]|nr:hypothetical protein [Chthoniobacterales bacterium]
MWICRIIFVLVLDLVPSKPSAPFRRSNPQGCVDAGENGIFEDEDDDENENEDD